MATVLSLPMVFLIMMLKMMQFLLIQTQDVKGELIQIKELINDVNLDGLTWLFL